MNPPHFSDAIDQRQFHEIKQLIEGAADTGDTMDGVANSVSWKTVAEESPQLGKIPRAEVAGIHIYAISRRHDICPRSG